MISPGLAISIAAWMLSPGPTVIVVASTNPDIIKIIKIDNNNFNGLPRPLLFKAIKSQ
jgi:hypothetical protein